jgi:hypothetical protein
MRKIRMTKEQLYSKKRKRRRRSSGTNKEVTGQVKCRKKQKGDREK